MKTVNICHSFRYGKIMYNVLDEFVGKSLKLYGEYSQGEADLFSQIIRRGDIIVEVGANIGSHTVHLAQLVGEDGKVYAFEPQRLVFQLLAGNMAMNNLNNVYCMQNCVADKHGVAKVPVLDVTKVQNWGGLSLNEGYEGEDVETITLDSLNLSRCDFLKIDAEGMEEQVLKGAEHLIDTCQPIIYTEMDRADKNPEICALLWNKGYKIYPHLPPLYNPSNFFGNTENVFMRDGKNIVSINAICLPKNSHISIEGVSELQK